MNASKAGGRTIRYGLSFLLAGATGLASRRAVSAEAPTLLREGLAIASGGRLVRTPFHTDPIEARIVAGTWAGPGPGDSVRLADGSTRAWERVVAKEDGNFEHAALRGGYFCLPYVADSDRILLLQAAGHTMVYVNGEPRVGDPYQNGSVSLPVALHRGTNVFLFATARGALRVGLAVPEKPVTLQPFDLTLPDLVSGGRNDTFGAVIVANATPGGLEGCRLVASSEGGPTTETPVPAILPLATRKVAFHILYSGRITTNPVAIQLRLLRGKTLLDTQTLLLGVRTREQTRRETFVSRLDGSVQYYSLVPAHPLPGPHEPLGLVLSAHGASVEAAGQAACYAPKTWVHIAAPTNRRPYGFDWEDWGRGDAMEVLDRVQQKLGTDPHRTYLTGHSMGGHGTWQLGVTFPDRFAAIAPSAGWISFQSYGGGKRPEATNHLQRLIQRAGTPGDTLALATNYLQQGIYILHGDADDNVPVSEARTMRRTLAQFHHDFTWHEQPGAGHWWGNQCVDWPPIFDWFARHRIPDDEGVGRLQFVTGNPGVSASCHWATIEAQEQALGRSGLDLRWDAGARRFTGATENVARLSLRLDRLAPGRVPTAELDGQSISNLVAVGAGERRVWLAKSGGRWQAAGPAPRSDKGPHRYGPFKEAFAHRMVFVYGTRGTLAENSWAFAKARFDAEQFWYRGNASVDVVPDTEFEATRDRDRGVIVYGNADNNAVWKSLLSESPVQVRSGAVRIGVREIKGTDLACLFLRPRPGSDVACVGVVSGSGLTGLRLTDRMPYFMAGVAFPDVTLFGIEALDQGWGGARAVGFFGNDWTVDTGEIAWFDEPESR